VSYKKRGHFSLRLRIRQGKEFQEDAPFALEKKPGSGALVAAHAKLANGLQSLSTNTVDKVVHTRQIARVSESRKRVFSFMMKT
jgi:hypothetical protein